MKCPKCANNQYVRNGYAKGKQRYKCKLCSCNFTRSSRHGYSVEVKFQAIHRVHYGFSARDTADALKISHVSIMRWVSKTAKLVNTMRKRVETDKNVFVRIMREKELFDYLEQNSKILKNKGDYSILAKNFYYKDLGRKKYLTTGLNIPTINYY